MIALERRWFNKMNRPTSGIYKLAHAVDPNSRSQTTFDPAKMRTNKETVKAHLTDHIKAVKRLTAKPGKRPARKKKK